MERLELVLDLSHHISWSWAIWPRFASLSIFEAYDAPKALWEQRCLHLMSSWLGTDSVRPETGSKDVSVVLFAVFQMLWICWDRFWVWFQVWEELLPLGELAVKAKARLREEENLELIAATCEGIREE